MMIARALIRTKPINGLSFLFKPREYSSQQPTKKQRIFTSMKSESPNTPLEGSSSRHAFESTREKKADQDIEQEEAARRERIQENIDLNVRKRQSRILKYTLVAAGMSSLAAFLYLGQPTEDEVTSPTESTFAAYRRRAKAGMTSTADSVSAPTYGEKLLPDMLPDPYQRPFTLVLELNDALVHLVWSKDIGWRVATRPGVKDFLAYLGKYYEIVLFADSPAQSTHPVADALDPYGYAMYKLYRESTRLVNNQTVKDLSALNRDLGRVVCVDVNPKMLKLQPENGVILKKWKGEKDDRELHRMMTFLEEIALFMTIANSKDIRPILKLMRSINPDDLPAAWETHKNKMRGKFGAETKPVTSSFGLFSRGSAASSAAGMSVFDIIERAGKEERAFFAKEQVENLATMEEMRRQAEEEQKKQIEDMKKQNLKMFDYLFGATQPANQAKSV